MFRKLPCVMQHDSKDCAAACLATISKCHKLSMPISKIREFAATDKRGTTGIGIIQAGEKLGFNVRAIRCDEGYIRTKLTSPVIAHVLDQGKFYHFVVIHQVTSKGIIIADPDKGIVRSNFEDFTKHWTGVLFLFEPNESFKSGNHSLSAFQRFLQWMRPHRTLLSKIFIASIIYSALGVIGSFYFRILFDNVLRDGLIQLLHLISGGALALHLLRTITQAYRSHLMNHLSQSIDHSLSLGYYNHILNLPLSFFETRKAGEIVSRFTDASKVREAISNAAITFMLDTLMVIVGGTILFLQNKTLFSIAALIAIVNSLLVVVFNSSVKSINKQQMEEGSALTSYIVESINGIETVKALNGERASQHEMENKYTSFLKSIFKGTEVQILQTSLSSFVTAIGGVLILWVGVYQVLKGNMSPGAVLTFNALLIYFLEPIKNLVNLHPTVQSAMNATARLSEIFELEVEKQPASVQKSTTKALIGNIEIEDLSFSYGTRKKVLNNISMKVHSGQKVALVGESGSGKTTLVKLLMKFYNSSSGTIRINQRDICELDISSLRESISYVSQDNFLFSGTIEENLLYGNSVATFEDIENVCKLVMADDFISKMPLKYHTVLEENGSNLSAGQRQRICIARMLLKKPEVLILDEATSNLDSITEKAIERAIFDQSHQLTAIIIAHRLSTIRRCDYIFVLEDGQIVESGRHEELLHQKGLYYKLWREQLQEDEILKTFTA